MNIKVRHSIKEETNTVKSRKFFYPVELIIYTRISSWSAKNLTLLLHSCSMITRLSSRLLTVLII